MAVGKDIEKRGHVTGFREEVEAARGKSKDAFFTWFNDAKDAEHAFIKGEADFNVHILYDL